MLLHETLKNHRIILASGSPRRMELLRGAGLTFTVAKNLEVEETYPENLPITQVAQYLSELKSKAFTEPLAPNDILLTADTVVICKGKVLGKPSNRAMAIAMLGQLSGGEHQVMSAVTIRTTTICETITRTSTVNFARLTDHEIEYYVDNYNPMDKAGSYGIQEWIGYIGIESISGSFYNVMGLPIHQLYSRLKELFAVK